MANPNSWATGKALALPSSQKSVMTIGQSNCGELRIPQVDKLAERVEDLERLVGLILEAIDLNHRRGKDGKCVKACWSCRVRETMDGIKTAKRLMGDKV